MLAKSVARSIDCSFRRIQFTPDLLPTDVTGVNVYNQERGDFEFKPGAVFANVVLADEINRASPKTQSALLESMEERQVTVDTVTYQLGSPFMVIATQNPIEHEGTYPLPEAQLDRFMMRLSIGYPSVESETAILATHGVASTLDDIQPVTDAPGIAELIAQAREVYVADTLRGYIVAIAEASRKHPELYLGASPRASITLLRASRAMAASESRDYVIPDDVKALAGPGAHPPPDRVGGRRDERPHQRVDPDRAAERGPGPGSREDLMPTRRGWTVFAAGLADLGGGPAGRVARPPHAGRRARRPALAGDAADPVDADPPGDPPAPVDRARVAGRAGGRPPHDREHGPDHHVVPAARGRRPRRAGTADAAGGGRHPAPQSPDAALQPGLQAAGAVRHRAASRSTCPTRSAWRGRASRPRRGAS